MRWESVEHRHGMDDVGLIVNALLSVSTFKYSRLRLGGLGRLGVLGAHEPSAVT